MKSPGTLFLIPSYLSEDTPDVLTPQGMQVVHQLEEFIVENEKSARRFLKLIGSPFPQANFHFHVLNEHTNTADLSSFIRPLAEGKNVGLMSEAGCPGVADPGSEVVRLAHAAGIRVKPLIGPSSLLLALMASGLNGQSFVFHGYLPREGEQRKQKIRDIEKDANRKNQAQIFIETPYRNLALLQDLLTQCNPETRLCIACNLTSPNEFILTLPVSVWKNNVPDLNKKPCIFLIGK